MRSHFPPGQLGTLHAYFGEFLLRQRGTAVHRNVSFESPPSSFLLSAPAARARARTRAGTNTGENPSTGDFSPTRKRALCCVFLECRIDHDGNWTCCQREGGRGKTDAFWGSLFSGGSGGVEVHSPKRFELPTPPPPATLRLAVITSFRFRRVSTIAAQPRVVAFELLACC